MRPFRLLALAAAVLTVCGVCAHAATPLRIAVASNFQAAAGDLADTFEARTGTKVKLSFGSTGALYAQISNGAPFDLFFAADEKRPRKLEEAGLTVRGSRFTYAVGQLVLWSRDPQRVTQGRRTLTAGTFEHLAIANPKLAPYGLAARQTLEHLGLWRQLRPRLVIGQNIGQTHQFVASGNAELGFVALSQVTRPGATSAGSRWVVPADLHAPIRQQAVSLTERPGTAAFADFVRSERGRSIIRGYGYSPGAPDQ